MGRMRSNSRIPATSCFQFPTDLLIEVLGRLPVKTLLKFRCVSKEWRPLIDSPYFASRHLNLYNNINPQNSRLVFTEGTWGNPNCSIRHIDTFKKTGQLALPNAKDFPNLRLEAYVNGLILFSKKDNLRTLGFLVWNPSTRKSIQITPPSCLPYSGSILVKFVCVRGPITTDYKLVLLPVFRSEPLPSSDSIDVYSLSTKSWRRCSIGSQCRWIVIRSRNNTTPFLHGAMHWCVYFTGSIPSCILAFDVQNEVFNHLCLPHGMVYRYSIEVSVVGESLALLDPNEGSYIVWVMEKYGEPDSWVKRFTIDLTKVRILYFKSNGEVLFSTWGKGFKTYNIESKEIKNVYKSSKNLIFSMDTFMETIMPLESDK